MQPVRLMAPHSGAFRRRPGSWPIVATAALASALLVWGVVAVVTAGPGTEVIAGDSLATGHGLTAAPPGTPVLREVTSVTDAAFHRGEWFVLDRRSAQVHRIDASGSLVESFGRQGEGPGEFRRPAAIASRGDSVVVVDGGILHLFRTDGDHIADRRIGLGGCGYGTVRDVLSVSTGLLMLVDCTAPGRLGWLVVLVPLDGPSRTLAVLDRDPDVVDLGMAWAVIGAHPQGFLFGLPEHDCLGLFSPRGGELGRVCHDWIERLPFPESVGRTITSLRERVKRSGARLVESDRMPPFTRVFLTGGDRLAYQAPLPEQIEVFRLVTSGVAGETAVFPLPPADGLFAAGYSVLLWWEDLEGTRISVRTLDAP